jgi:translocation and assembly module TamB
MRRRLILAALLMPMTAMAQEDDRDFLTAFLEDNLSGAGRQVTITGFDGALSSRATIEQIAIADGNGVWITLEDVVLDWSRSSLLSGEVVVNELSAAVITLDRMPEMPQEEGLPAPEAGGFALPELPVSVDIGSVAAARIVLGEAVLGEVVEGRLDAALALAGGEGSGQLVLERTDGPESRITLEAAYSNASGTLSLDLQAAEAADGLFSHLLGLPGVPSVDFSVSGAGPLSDFSAEIALATDGVTRLQGPVTIAAEGEDAHRFAAQVAGDLAPLFLPDYAAFLGDRVALDLTGTRWASGRVVLDQLALEARALRVDGTASIAGDGLPEALDVLVALGLPDGSAVLLPLTGPETRVTSARFALGFDGRTDAGWRAEGELTGFDRDGLRLDRARLDGSGRIGRLGAERSLGATLRFVAEGLSLADAAQAAAMGPQVEGRAVLHWQDGEDAISLPVVDLRGADYGATANLRIEGLATGLRTSGSVTLRADDLARFSALAGRPLAGAGDVRLTGSISSLSGAFDIQAEVKGRGLAVGVAQADRLLAGDSVLTASVLRDETGTALRALEVAAKGMRLTARGTLASDGSRLDGRLTAASLADLDPAWGGSLVADAGFTGTLAEGLVTLSGTGQSLSIGQTEVDRLLAGETALRLGLAVTDGVARLSEARLQGRNLQAEARGQPGSEALQVTGRLADLALLAPGFPGPVTLSGRIVPLAAGSDLDLRILGPAGVDVTLRGRLEGASADLRLTGSGNAAVLNGLADPTTLSGALNLDLALQGPLALRSLSGRITLTGGRIAYPLRGLALGRTEVIADLAQGSARLAATADVQSGGRIRLGGTVALTAPFDAALDIFLENARLRDAELFDTVLNGALRLTGPALGRALLSGSLTVRETELVVPDTGFSSASDLAAIEHLRDSAEVRATRARAGVNGSGPEGSTAAGSSGPDWALDLLIEAPNRIFLRGRGLDAELGGSVRLGGTLGNVQPAGAISLIRGRLDLLGKRLDLSEASLALEGDLVPYLRVVASNETEGVISIVTIEGPASAPDVTFSSLPELPQEEVLAWLLFGRGLDTISAFQAVQLANAVAVLAGRGGTGLVDRLRQGFGFDDLDISTAEDGTASVAAGKYISRNVYSEIEVDQQGKSKVSLNLDVRPGVTVKGSVGSDGESGIGIFLEGDY